MIGTVTWFARVWLLVMLLLAAIALSPPEASVMEPGNTVGNAACPGEEVFFAPGSGEDILVPSGFRVEVFATGLNFPASIAFRGTAEAFEVFVTEVGTALPGRCNSAEFFAAATESPDAENPFLAQVRVLNQRGETLRVLGRPPTVERREKATFLHAPTIGITFERGFDGGRLFVSDSRQGVLGGLGPTNSSRIVELEPTTGALTELITGLPTGLSTAEQLTARDGFLYWSQSSATNAGVVGHDNGARVGGPPDLETQHDIPCQDVVLSGNNFDSGDGHITGGFLPHGVPGEEGQVVKAFTGATQPGMCTGAILRASLDDPQHTVEPFSWGYRNPFGIRFAPDDHPLKGALLLTEAGEDEQGARPVSNAPDRVQVTRGGLDYHGWPDRFGFLDSISPVFDPIASRSENRVDNPEAVVGKAVLPLLLFPPQSPLSPRVIKTSRTAPTGLDFVPAAFAGGSAAFAGGSAAFAGSGSRRNLDPPVETPQDGDACITEEGALPEPDPPVPGETALIEFQEAIPPADIVRFFPSGGIQIIRFFPDGGVQTARFALNCRREDQITDPEGRRRCAQAANQAFVAQLEGFNRPVDGKFGPDGAFYLVDFGAVKVVSRSSPNRPFVQIPGTGVIWRISPMSTVEPLDSPRLKR